MTSARLLIELVYDDEVGTWHYAIPSLHAVGGGARSRDEAVRMAEEAAAFALEAEDEGRVGAGYLRVSIEPKPETLSA